MTPKADQIIEESGVAYFGTMTASISHEIKNCLAIMNENAGLMTDLILLSRQQPPLDGDRLEKITARITGQIQRADAIIKNLNEFSHSMDKTAQTLDLYEAIQLAAALGSRICANRRVTVQAVLPEQPVHVTAPFFFLLYLIWTAMEGAMADMPPGSVLDVVSFERDGRPAISFGAPMGKGFQKALSSPTGQNLLTLVSAEAAMDLKNQQAELIFSLPAPVAE